MIIQAPNAADLDETDKTSILMEVDDKPGALHEVSDTWTEDFQVLLCMRFYGRRMYLNRPSNSQRGQHGYVFS